jgi:hypothetical protein
LQDLSYSLITFLFHCGYDNANIFMPFTDIHWSANCSALGVIGFVESGLVAIVILGSSTCLPESGLERFYLVLIGFLSFFAQISLTLAALFESAANIGLLVKGFDVVLAFIFQILFFQVSFTIMHKGGL